MKQSETTKKNILIVENSKAVTGAFNAAFNMAQSLKSEFGFVFLFPGNSKCIDSVRENSFSVYQSAYPLVSKRVYSLLSFVPNAIFLLLALSRIIRKEKISIVHINDLYNFVPYAIKIFYPNLKIVTHIRFRRKSLPARYYDFLVKLALKYADLVISVSDVVIKDSPLLAKHDKVKRIYDGFSLNEKLPYQYRVTDEDNKIKVLYLANYTEGKGHEEMLLAFEQVVKIREDIFVTFAGDDLGLEKNRQYKARLHEIACQKGLNARVVFWPRIEEVEPLYKGHQLFVNLSSIESFSFTCLEALCYGVPCIAYNSGGPAEILAGGKYGVLLETKNPDSVSAALVELAENCDKRIQLSIAGRVYAAEKFSAQNNQLFREAYNGLLS